MPRALEELKDKNAHAVADGPQGGPERSGGLALAGAGVDEDEAFSHDRVQGTGYRDQAAGYVAGHIRRLIEGDLLAPGNPEENA
jgi:hypothetical protein